MKLIIKEYLTLLKESEELDVLLPNLLLSMGIEPITKPQIGPRQYGVDVAAIGTYEDEIETLFLFTIKSGDIGRSDWDSNSQSVRQSLDEIQDVYLSKYIRPEHELLRKQVIVCTGGELKQQVQQNWNGYISRNEVKGEIEYRFWGGDKLALLIEEFMFNENILPSEFNSSVRKTLALLTDPDYEPTDYYRAVQKLLLDTEYDVSTTSGIKKLQRTIQTVSLSLSIIIHWSVSENNLTSSLKCSARILLYSWEFIRKNSLFDNEYASQNFARVNSLFLFIYSSYLDKIHPYCMTKNGLSGYGNSFILESINIFQHIGYIGLISVTSLNHAQTLSDEQNDFSYKLAEFSKDCLKSLIMNHPATFSPVYDSHIIEISIALLVLAAFSETEFIDHWIGQLFTHIIFAYRNMGRYFPIQSDSFDDLLALNVSNTIQKTQLFQMSTLIPILAQWCAVLNLDETYTLIQDTMKEFSECNLQIWYPDSDTDEHLYTKNAGYYSGAMEASINLPETPLELKQRIQKAKMHLIDPTDISTLKFGLNYIPLVASHHYRTPILPIYWQAFNDIS